MAQPLDEALIRELIAAMGASIVNTNNNIAAMAQVIGNQQQTTSGSGGYRALKPKKEMTQIKAEDARSLMIEIMQFEVDLGELGITVQSEAAYRQLRAMAIGKARDVIDLELVQGNGLILKTELDSYQLYGAQVVKDHCGGRLYYHLLDALQRAVRLTPAKRLEIAELVSQEARMYADTVQEGEAFLAKWRRARHLLYKENLVAANATNVRDALLQNGTPQGLAEGVYHSMAAAERREMNIFLQERVSESVYTFIKSHWRPDEVPRNVGDCVRLVEVWVEMNSRKQDAKATKGVSALHHDSPGEGQTPGTPGAASGTGGSHPAGTSVSVGGGLPAGISRMDQANNAGYVASFGQGGPGAGKGGAAWRPSAPASVARQPPGAVMCPTCHGYHPDLRTCPCTLATQDTTFTPSATAKCSWKVDGQHPCDGVNHFSRHHRQQWIVEHPNMTMPPANRIKGKGGGTW